MAVSEPEPEYKHPRELTDAYSDLLKGERQRAETAERRADDAESESARLKGEIAQLNRDVQRFKDAEIGPLADQLMSAWLRKREQPKSAAPLSFEDPVYGELEIDSKLLPIYLHPLFQRLNYIRQLSFAYLVFPSASHTRLSHILGVTRNARLALRTVFYKDRLYTRDGSEPIHEEFTREQQDRCCRKAELCALLHDIGHGPFGHALDKPMSYLASEGEQPDKFFSAKYVAEVLEGEIQEAGFTPGEVLDVLVKDRRTELSGWDVFIADLIDSNLDVDRLDYLPRDAHMTGLAMGTTNVQAFVEHMCPFKEGGNVSLAFHEAALPHLEHLLYAHHVMYINCYEHHRKLCAERLLSRLVEFVIEKGVSKETLMLLTDEQLFTLLDRCLPRDGPQRECLRSIQENRDFRPVAMAPYALSKAVWDANDNRFVFQFNEDLHQEIEAWYRRRPQGESYLKSVFCDMPKSWEDTICSEAEITPENRWKVVVTVPAYEAKQAEESGTRVLIKEGSGYSTKDLYEISPVKRAVITNLIPAREVIHVLVSEDLSDADAAKVAEAADGVFRRQQEHGKGGH